MATQDTVTQLVAAIRRVIREVPGAPEAAAARCTAHDYRDPGKPSIACDDEQAREALVRRPDARHVHKNRARHQDGFKAHVSFEPEAGLFTAVEVTGGSGPDSHAAAVRLLAGEEAGLTILGDSAFGTGELRRHLRDAGHAAVIKPALLRPAVPGGFTIDDQAGTVTCPAGHAVTLGRPQATGTRQAQFKALCHRCPLRQRCRQWRPPAERAIAWLVARGSRRVPYRGITSSNAWLRNRAAALNLRRLINLGLSRATSGTWALT